MAYCGQLDAGADEERAAEGQPRTPFVSSTESSVRMPGKEGSQQHPLRLDAGKRPARVAAATASDTVWRICGHVPAKRSVRISDCCNPAWHPLHALLGCIHWQSPSRISPFGPSKTEDTNAIADGVEPQPGRVSWRISGEMSEPIPPPTGRAGVDAMAESEREFKAATHVILGCCSNCCERGDSCQRSSGDMLE